MTFICFYSRTQKTIAELEKEMLNGQKLQGPETAEEVNILLKSKNLEARWDHLHVQLLVMQQFLKIKSLLDSPCSRPFTIYAMAKSPWPRLLASYATTRSTCEHSLDRSDQMERSLSKQRRYFIL